MKELRVVFDMDGVLLDSEEMKVASFRDLFLAYPERIEEIHRYNRATQGVPRKLKIEHVLGRILGLPANQEDVEALSAEYARIVMSKADDLPLLPGVRGFLDRPGFRFFVNSSAPIEEIGIILEKKGIRNCFEEVFGFPSKKSEVLMDLKTRVGGNRTVFFGDALSDLKAAREADVPFIGIDGDRGDRSPFAGTDVLSIRDFNDPGLFAYLEKIGEQ